MLTFWTEFFDHISPLAHGRVIARMGTSDGWRRWWRILWVGWLKRGKSFTNDSCLTFTIKTSRDFRSEVPVSSSAKHLSDYNTKNLRGLTYTIDFTRGMILSACLCKIEPPTIEFPYSIPSFPFDDIIRSTSRQDWFAISFAFTTSHIKHTTGRKRTL
jgi:hypothetical protein